MPLITAAQLARVAPHAAPHIVSAIVDHASDVLVRYKLATVARLTDFLAHVLVESAYLTRVDENLNYSAERLHEVWPKRFPTVASAEPYARNPRALANKVYGGRMGNTGPDDGYENRGQGLLSTTGHDNITDLAKDMKVSFAEARSMLTASATMLECAAANYCRLGAPKFADKGDIVGSTRAVNGGTNGLTERRKMLALCQKVWPRVTPPPVRSAATPRKAPPILTPSAKPTVKQTTLLALVLSLFGITAAHAGDISATPLIDAGINYILVPVLAATVPTIAALLVMPLRRFLDERTANLFKDNVNDWLDKAISAGAKEAGAYADRSDFHVNVDGWVANLAAQYAVKNAPKMAKKVGDLLTDKIQARIASHADVLALKATVPGAAAA